MLPSPSHDCPLCPRLVAYRRANQATNPEWFNAPVPGFGPLDAPIAIIGMAPGVRGANRTGRPFTGDYAGMLLYGTLLKFGLARGVYDARADDGIELDQVRIVNAVRCVPPANQPLPVEVRTCSQFLEAELRAMTGLRAVLTLGVLAHGATVRAFGQKPTRLPFKHGQVIEMPGGIALADSYHVSRYNTSTGVLTTAMFEAVVADVKARIGL